MPEEMTEAERNGIWESMHPEMRVMQGRYWDAELRSLSEMDGVMRKLVWRGKILDYFIASVDYSDHLNLPEGHPYHEEKGDFTAFVEHPCGYGAKRGDVGKYLVFPYVTGRMPEDGCPRPNDPAGAQLLDRLDRKFAELDEGEIE